MTCDILVPRPGMEAMAPAMEAWGPNHWTTREFPSVPPFKTVYIAIFYMSSFKRKDHFTKTYMY